MSERDFVGYVRGTLSQWERNIRESKDYLVREVERMSTLEKAVEDLVLEELVDDHANETMGALFKLLSQASQEKIRLALHEAKGLPPGTGLRAKAASPPRARRA